MPITSWASDGMDWNNPNPEEAKYYEAIRLACIERALASYYIRDENHNIGTWPSYLTKMSFLNNSDISNRSSLVGTFCQHVETILHINYGPTLFRHYMPVDETIEGKEIGDIVMHYRSVEHLLEGTDATTLERYTVGQRPSKEWLIQKYTMLNKLRFSFIKFPQYSGYGFINEMEKEAQSQEAEPEDRLSWGAAKSISDIAYSNDPWENRGYGGAYLSSSGTKIDNLYYAFKRAVKSTPWLYIHRFWHTYTPNVEIYLTGGRNKYDDEDMPNSLGLDYGPLKKFDDKQIEATGSDRLYFNEIDLGMPTYPSEPDGNITKKSVSATNLCFKLTYNFQFKDW